MIFPKPTTEKERMNYRRESYENEKEGLIAFFNQQGYDNKDLNAFLFNSLKDNYESELKEDGIIA